MVDGKKTITAYGLVTKGNGEAWTTLERHTVLSTGGGMPGQGYPCVLIVMENKNESNNPDREEVL